jgi:hypothetical protein
MTFWTFGHEVTKKGAAVVIVGPVPAVDHVQGWYDFGAEQPRKGRFVLGGHVNHPGPWPRHGPRLPRLLRGGTVLRRPMVSSPVITGEPAVKNVGSDGGDLPLTQ